MKKWMFFVLVALLLVATNPPFDAHAKVVDRELGFLGRGLAGLFVGPFVRQNWILFSLGTYGDKVVTVGVLGQVFWVV